MSIQEEYKYFIENCTSTPKSYKNYSDFSRICKTVAHINGLKDFDIYNITTVKELEELINILENNDEFSTYNKKGGNQYSNALRFYLRFLKAKEFFSSNKKNNKVFKKTLHPSLQQIFYGAPGTGKSHTIKEQTSGEDVVRTTFHPDSDYSTFVGAYKPTTKTVPVTTVIGTKAVPVEGADGKPMTEEKLFTNLSAKRFYKRT